jgi:hypothetical protein
MNEIEQTVCKAIACGLVVGYVISIAMLIYFGS